MILLFVVTHICITSTFVQYSPKTVGHTDLLKVVYMCERNQFNALLLRRGTQEFQEPVDQCIYSEIE